MPSTNMSSSFTAHNMSRLPYPSPISFLGDHFSMNHIQDVGVSFSLFKQSSLDTFVVGTYDISTKLQWFEDEDVLTFIWSFNSYICSKMC